MSSSTRLMTGRMRDRIQILSETSEPDEWGLVNDNQVIGMLSANIKVISGDNLESYGVDLDSEIITCLTRYRPNVRTGQSLIWVKMNKKYNIKHVRKGDDRYMSMVITAELLP